MTGVTHGHTRVDKKTKLSITDDSKFGTTLNGQRFCKETIVLDNNEHSIRLGSFDQLLKLKWVPIVLTSTTHRAPAIDANHQDLEPLDVKLITEFLFDRTTHTIASKRNLPKVLQSIISAKYIVTHEYIDAIITAAKSPGVDEDGQTPLPSLLEQNFDAHWPDAMKFVPPPSVEPVARDAHYLKPDPQRESLLEGFTFVFLDPQQRDTLEPALSLAGAKCPLIEVERLVTKVEDVTAQIRQLAGKASNEAFNEDSPKGVVVVRTQPKKDDTPELSDWTTRFVHDVQRDLDQRSVEQREFLDVILTKDTSGLKRHLEYEDEATSMPPPSLHQTTSIQSDQQPASEPIRSRRRQPSAQTSQDEQPRHEQSPSKEPTSTSARPQNDAQPSPEPAPRPSRLRSRRLGTAKAKFTGFDDFADADPIAPAAAADDALDEGGPPSNQAAAGTQDMGVSRRLRKNNSQNHSQNQQAESQGLFVSDSQNAPSTRARKRPPSRTEPDPEPVDNEAAMDDLLPGSRALKKRRLQQPSPSHTPPATTHTPGSSDSDAPARPASKAGKDMKKRTTQQDLRQRAREHVNAMDKVKRESEERELNADDEEVRKLRDLVIVEEMDVPGLRAGSPSKGPTSRSSNASTAKGKGKRKAPATEKATTRRRGSKSNTRTRQDDSRDTETDPYAGRKNFKRFRRKGEGRSDQYNRGTRVIVDVEVEEPKDYGIGDKYWVSFSPSSSSRSKKKSQSQTQRDLSGSTSGRGRHGGDRGAGGGGDDKDDQEMNGEDDEDHLPFMDDLTRRAIENEEREEQRLNEMLPEELAGPTDQTWVHEKLQQTQQSLSLQKSTQKSSARSKGGSSGTHRSSAGAGSGTRPESGHSNAAARSAVNDSAGQSAGQSSKKRGSNGDESPAKRRQTAKGRETRRQAKILERVDEEESEDDPFAFKLRRR
ncbi:MAG: hypothetical protein Q9159_002338 [Coniocarpon cinnabarinum]